MKFWSVYITENAGIDTLSQINKNRNYFPVNKEVLSVDQKKWMRHL